MNQREGNELDQRYIVSERWTNEQTASQAECDINIKMKQNTEFIYAGS